MAPDKFNCALCQAAIETSAGQVVTQIVCAVCGAINAVPEAAHADRWHNEAPPWEAASPPPGPSGDSPFPPFPQSGTGAYYAKPTKNSAPGRWLIALAIVVPVVVVIVAGIVLLSNNNSNSMSSNAGWYRYNSEPGRFTALFPEEPSEEAKDIRTVSFGDRTFHRARCMFHGVNYEITYYEVLPPGSAELYEFDASPGFAFLARQIGGQVVSEIITHHQGWKAQRAKVENNTGYRCETLALWADGKVYMVICERNDSGPIEFEPFLNGFDLKAPSNQTFYSPPSREDTSPQPWSSPADSRPPIPEQKPRPLAIWMGTNTRYAFTGQDIELKFPGEYGEPPYTWQVSGYPEELVPSIEDSEYKIKGVLKTPGTFAIQLELKDKAGSKKTATFHLIVGETPLTAGGFTPRLPRGYQRCIYSGFLGINPPKQPSSIEWLYDKSKLPPGITARSSSVVDNATSQVNWGLEFEGRPSITGEFSVEITCQISFVDTPELKSQSTVTVTLIIGEGRGECLKPLLGNVTLLIIDKGGYSQEEYLVMAHTVMDLVVNLPTKYKFNAWWLNYSQWVAFPYSPKPRSGGDLRPIWGAIGDMNNLADAKHDMGRALTTITEADLEPYDSIILVTPLRYSDMGAGLEKIKSELERLGSINGKTITVVTPKALPSEAFTTWLESKNLKFLQLKP